jgi:hypothetical protein
VVSRAWHSGTRNALGLLALPLGVHPLLVRTWMPVGRCGARVLRCCAHVCLANGGWFTLSVSILTSAATDFGVSLGVKQDFWRREWDSKLTVYGIQRTYPARSATVSRWWKSIGSLTAPELPLNLLRGRQIIRRVTTPEFPNRYVWVKSRANQTCSAAHQASFWNLRFPFLDCSSGICCPLSNRIAVKFSGRIRGYDACRQQEKRKPK